MEVGDMIRLDDRVTGFDDNKPKRPYLVVNVEQPPLYVWVLPRTSDTRGTGAGILVRGGVIRTLDKDGRFMYRPYRVAIEEVETLEVFAHLSGGVLERVLSQVNAVEIDVD
jgi:hypothetical protein